jgi:putative Ca2+/H+ antiporter (TMEM165/GDT1 family)
MDLSMASFFTLFTCFLFVVIGEMGDKTQLLAMAFATKIKAWKVMIGVFIATVLNHGLAVLTGSLIAHIVWLQNWISLVAAVAFVFFGIWTVHGDSLEGEDKRKTRFGAIATVAIAFFFAEMGDKTQLLTISLAADPKFAPYPLAILIGTTIGMLIADGIGIILGVILHKRIPEGIIKIFAAAAFIVFGLIGIFEALTEKFKFDTFITIVIVTIIAVISFSISWVLVKNRR